MERMQIISRIESRIISCHVDMLIMKNNNKSKESVECFRNRLDELLLLYCAILKITFLDACKFFKIKYEDVDTPKP